MSEKDHPTIKWFNENSEADASKKSPSPVDLEKLKRLAKEAGADDCGSADINSPELEKEKSDILALHPKTEALISIVISLNCENVRCVSRAVSDLEFIRGMEQANTIAQKLSLLLRNYGINSLLPSPAFPMDVSKWPGKMWSVSHKTVAIASGMGHMGHNRLLIHPDFGNFIVLGTLLIDRDVTSFDKPLEYNPCIKCGLCVSACPVGAIAPDGSFSFINCMTHNYRDRLGGFSDWVENIVKSRNVKDYRFRVKDTETVSMWQSLSYGICNKSSYCMAACPAGKKNIGQYLSDKKEYRKSIIKPLQENNETIFVIPRSDALEYVAKKYPHKKIKKGLVGKPDISVIADTKTWLDFLAKEKNLILALLQRKIKIKGSPTLIKNFAKCFPL